MSGESVETLDEVRQDDRLLMDAFGQAVVVLLRAYVDGLYEESGASTWLAAREGDKELGKVARKAVDELSRRVEEAEPLLRELEKEWEGMRKRSPSGMKGARWPSGGALGWRLGDEELPVRVIRRNKKSYAVTIPRPVLERAGLEPGQRMRIYAGKGHIILGGI